MAATQTAAGTTASGTAWRRYMDTIPTGGTIRWGIPESRIGEAGTPMMLYTHGAGGGPNDFEAIAAWQGIRDYLLDNGIGWIEGSGGGSQPWANDATKAAYEATWQYGADLFQPSVTFGMFRSMGGLVGQWLLTQSEVVAPYMQGAMINSGVQDLMWAYQWGRWTDAMNAAWGVSSYAEFQIAAQASDPMQFDPSVWAGTQVMQLVGTADSLVPAEDNGLAIRARYSGQPAIDLLDNRQGGDHSQSNGSYLQTAAMAAMVNLIVGITPPAPTDDKRFREVLSVGRLVGSTWRPLRHAR